MKEIKEIIIILTRFLFGGKFTGLYDADNRPLFECDEYVVFTKYDPKTHYYFEDQK